MTLHAPLAGLKVLDFGHTIMGPCAGLLLADLGADVIKIEPIEGESTRRMPGFAAGFFSTFNRNKRSLAVDLKRAEGQAVLHRLLAQADVLLENFGPGTIERLGCGWEEAQRINPRLIYLSLKGYLAGPYEHRGALDEVVQMQTGIATMTGPPGRPLRAAPSICDILGGVFGVVAVQAALRERDSTGRGQRVGSALFEAATFLVGTYLAGTAILGERMPPLPARRGGWGIYDVFTGSDGGQVFIAVTSDQLWQRFCDAFVLPQLLADERLASNALRAAERSWTIPALGEVMAMLPAADIIARCEAASIPYAPVQHPADLAQDPHLLASGGLLETEMRAARTVAEMAGLPALPMEFGDDRGRLGLRRQPPTIGQHSTEVLQEAGFTAAEIAALRDAGTILAGGA